MEFRFRRVPIFSRHRGRMIPEPPKIEPHDYVLTEGSVFCGRCGQPPTLYGTDDPIHGRHWIDEIEGYGTEARKLGILAFIEAGGFPEHNPDFPDVDPRTGDERETTDLDG